MKVVNSDDYKSEDGANQNQLHASTTSTIKPIDNDSAVWECADEMRL